MMRRALNIIVLLMMVMSAFPQAQRDRKREPVRLCRRCEKIVAQMPLQRPVMDSKNFDKLSHYVKSESFDDDRLILIRVAAMGCCFTSEQCAKLLSFFSFDSNRITALKVLRPYIVETKNSKAIIKEFTFSSEKDAAIEILLRE